MGKGDTGRGAKCKLNIRTTWSKAQQRVRTEGRGPVRKAGLVCPVNHKGPYTCTSVPGSSVHKSSEPETSQALTNSQAEILIMVHPNAGVLLGCKKDWEC